MGCKRSPGCTRVTEGPSWCNSDVWCDRYGGGQVWVLGTGVVRKKSIGGVGGVQEEAVCYLTEAQDWEEPTLEWIGLGWILF